MEKKIPHNVQNVPNKCHVCGGWRLRPLDQIGISQSNELLNILLLRQRESSEAYKMITAQIKANKEIIKEVSICDSVHPIKIDYKLEADRRYGGMSFGNDRNRFIEGAEYIINN